MKFKKRVRIYVHQLLEALFHSLVNVLVIPVGNMLRLLMTKVQGMDLKIMYVTLDRAIADFYSKCSNRLKEYAARKGIGRNYGGIFMNQLKIMKEIKLVLRHNFLRRKLNLIMSLMLNFMLNLILSFILTLILNKIQI